MRTALIIIAGIGSFIFASVMSSIITMYLKPEPKDLKIPDTKETPEPKKEEPKKKEKPVVSETIQEHPVQSQTGPGNLDQPSYPVQVGPGNLTEPSPIIQTGPGNL